MCHTGPIRGLNASSWRISTNQFVTQHPQKQKSMKNLEKPLITIEHQMCSVLKARRMFEGKVLFFFLLNSYLTGLINCQLATLKCKVLHF